MGRRFVPIFGRCREQGRVIDREGSYRRLHSFCHEVLGLRVDHSVLFRQQIPRWLRFPGWCRSRLLDALDGDRSLNRPGQSNLLVGRVLCEGIWKSLVRHPDEAVRIRGELRRFWMSLVFVKDLGDCLAFIWCQSSHVDQSLDSLITSCGNNGTSIGITCNDYWPIRPCDHPLQGRRIIVQRRPSSLDQ